MNVLLMIAHGSPRPEANDDVRRVAAMVRSRNAWDTVTIAYLDCNEPDIATAIDDAVALGATGIAAVPYFLHTGKHLLRDIPNALRTAAARHPTLRITLGDCVGHQPQIAEILRDRYEEAVRTWSPHVDRASL